MFGRRRWLGVLGQRFLLALSIAVSLLVPSGVAWAEKQRVLRIGYQKSSSLLLAKLDGQLEKAFREQGVSVEWREFTSGPPLLQGISNAALCAARVHRVCQAEPGQHRHRREGGLADQRLEGAVG